MLLASPGPGKDLPPRTRGGRSQRHLVSDTAQDRLVLLVAGLAAMSTNTTSHRFARTDTSLADTAVPSSESLKIWLLLVTFFISLGSSSQFKVRQAVDRSNLRCEALDGKMAHSISQGQEKARTAEDL